MSMRALMSGSLAALAVAAVAAVPAAAQSAQIGWSPWVGCWQAEGAPGDAALCIRPAETEDGAVEILRVEEGQILDREVIWADGARHETVRESCTGWEEGRFSRDGRRLFLRSSHTCEDGMVQEGGGIMAMATPEEWLDVRYLEVADEPTAWVQRYRPAELGVWEALGMHDLAPQRVSPIWAARVAAAEAPDVEDVIEASEHVPAQAVEAWIAEKGDPFRLDVEELVALDAAGVSDRVIDVVVAVSNPDVFVLANDGEPERARTTDADGRYRGRAYSGRLGLGLYDPFYYSRLRYSPFYSYGWSPFGYGGWGYSYGGYYNYGYRPTVIVVDRKDDTPSRRSRVIAGRGYRNPSSGSGGSGGVMRPSGASQSGGAATSSPRPSSRPSGGEPRKAKPRRPGGSGGEGLL